MLYLAQKSAIIAVTQTKEILCAEPLRLLHPLFKKIIKQMRFHISLGRKFLCLTNEITWTIFLYKSILLSNLSLRKQK